MVEGTDIIPSPNFLKVQVLPLRSKWRFRDPGVCACGTIEIRRYRSFFWSRREHKFCVITKNGLLLIYNDSETGVAIDIKKLRSVRTHFSDKINSKRCLIAHCTILLRRKSSERLSLRIYGKVEIAKWRCAFHIIASQHCQTPMLSRNRASLSFFNTIVKSSIRKRVEEDCNSDSHFVQKNDKSKSLPNYFKNNKTEETECNMNGITELVPSECDIEYWNNPAAGKLMTSPQLFRVLSSRSILRRGNFSDRNDNFKKSFNPKFDEDDIQINTTMGSPLCYFNETLSEESLPNNNHEVSFNSMNDTEIRQTEYKRQPAKNKEFQNEEIVPTDILTQPQLSPDSGISNESDIENDSYMRDGIFLKPEQDTGLWFNNNTNSKNNENTTMPISEPLEENQKSKHSSWNNANPNYWLMKGLHRPEYLSHPTIILPILSVNQLNIASLFLEALPKTYED